VKTNVIKISASDYQSSILHTYDRDFWQFSAIQFFGVFLKTNFVFQFLHYLALF
jgi:hypothetical protein